MRYISKQTGIGIGCCTVPGRKNKSLVYIQGNRETVIGTVRNEELFHKAVEEIRVMGAVSRIEVKEVYYDNDRHCYSSRPLVVMTDRIETIREFYEIDSGAKSKLVTMSGDVIRCKESYIEIMKKWEGE